MPSRLYLTELKKIEMAMDTAKLSDIKMKIDSDALGKAKEKVMESLPKSDSKTVADLLAAFKVTQSLMEKPPPNLADDQAEKINTVCTQISEFAPLLEQAAFLLDKIENSGEVLTKITRELKSLNALLKKLRGDGFFSRLVLLCAVRNLVASIEKQIARLQEPVDQLPEMKGQLESKLEEYVTEEATKMAEEEAAKLLEENSGGLLDRVADALGMS